MKLDGITVHGGPSALPLIRPRSEEPKLPWGELIREPSMVALPRMKAMCHDCAFHPKGSPEQDDIHVRMKLLEGADEGQPFFCHQGMPVDKDGAYRPQLGPRGEPIGAHVCAGWLETRARMVATARRDLDDEMRRMPIDAPDTFAVALIATYVSLP